MTTILFLDTNELATNPTIASELSRFYKVIPIALQAGDINIPLSDKLLVIERKQPADLLSSIADGRLFNQAERMVNLSPWSFIIINGSICYNSDDWVLQNDEPTNWRGRSVRNALLAVQLSGCAVIYTDGIGLIPVIDDILHYCTQEHLASPHKQRLVTFPPADPRVELLSQFPGVGPKRAKALLEWVHKPHSKDPLGSIANAIEWATLFPLLSETDHPEGWGATTISNFRKALGLSPEEFIITTKEKPT